MLLNKLDEDDNDDKKTKQNSNSSLSDPDTINNDLEMLKLQNTLS